MRRITTWLLSTISALVLLFSYHTSTNTSASPSVVAESDTAPESSGSGTTDSGMTDSGTTDSGTTDSGASAAGGSGTYTGDAITTRFGPVQVEITVVDGRITASEVTQVPWNDRKDQEINGRAVPVLNAAAVDAQSADIDMVSGATYTSAAYIESLQSAIDQANR
jgi:uncharacterized protein with FMN-binding domain